MILFIDLGKISFQYINFIIIYNNKKIGTDIAPAIALAYEEPESFIMKKPPRKLTEHLIDLKLMINAYGTIGIF